MFNSKLSDGQMDIILAKFKSQPSTIDHFMDWYAVDKIDEFVLDNNQLTRDHDWTDHQIEKLNDLYNDVRCAIHAKHNLPL